MLHKSRNMDAFVKKFTDIRLADVATVGGKNASLGEMIGTLSGKGIKVPEGFATTAMAFVSRYTENGPFRSWLLGCWVHPGAGVRLQGCDPAFRGIWPWGNHCTGNRCAG